MMTGFNVSDIFSNFFLGLDSYLNAMLFFKISSFPIVILWILLLGIVCTLRFNFINIRFFHHALSILFGRKSKKGKGVITHFQAFFTSISGTVGLGTISGVAIAITTGGPGSVLWMSVIGVFGMSIKFAEVTLAFKYRTGSGDVVFSGPFQYMKKGLAELGYAKLGKIVATFYALVLIVAMAFGGIPFQANQTVMMFSHLFSGVVNHAIISLVLTFMVALVIVGGIRRIANVNMSLTPIMTVLYIVGCIIIILMNKERLYDSLHIMCHDMVHGSSVHGGILGCLVAGVRRSVFANEAGIGTAAIAHAATKDNVPVRAGCTAMLEPCVDTIIISFLTGIVIVITGTYKNIEGVGDIALAGSAFLSISPFFGYVIFPFIVFSFAFSTIVAYSYYCEVAWMYLFGRTKNIILCRAVIILLVFVSGLATNVASISSLGDSLFMMLTIPNGVAIYLLSKTVNIEIKQYRASHVNGETKKNGKSISA